MTESPGSAGLPDPRPRPQYGEYATPEEQQARITQPYASEALTAGLSPDAPAAGGPAPVALPTEAPRWGGQPTPAAAPGPRPLSRWRLADRVITIGLLVYGLFNVVVSSSQLFAFEQFANTYLSVVGIDETFSNVEQGRLWGAVSAVVLIVGWALTALLSWLQLRRGRLAFWIPLVGALVTGIAVTVFICIPIFNDPAFATWFDRLATSGR